VTASQEGLTVTGSNSEGASGTVVCPNGQQCQVTVNTGGITATSYHPVNEIVSGGTICIPFVGCDEWPGDVIGPESEIECPAPEAALRNTPGTSLTYRVASLLHAEFPNVPIEDKAAPTAFEALNQCICDALPASARGGFNCHDEQDARRFECLKSPWGPDDGPRCADLLKRDHTLDRDNDCNYMQCPAGSLLTSIDAAALSGDGSGPGACVCFPIQTLIHTQGSACEQVQCPDATFCVDGACQPYGGGSVLPPVPCSPMLATGARLFGGGVPVCSP
jgi:hypothetical protein